MRSPTTPLLALLPLAATTLIGLRSGEVPAPAATTPRPPQASPDARVVIHWPAPDARTWARVVGHPAPSNEPPETATEPKDPPLTGSVGR